MLKQLLISFLHLFYKSCNFCEEPATMKLWCYVGIQYFTKHSLCCKNHLHNAQRAMGTRTYYRIPFKSRINKWLIKLQKT